MHLTNNYVTAYNLILYTQGIYRRRILEFIEILNDTKALRGSRHYRNMEPWGNISREFTMNKKTLMRNSGCI